MSALPLKADMCSALVHVGFEPKADIAPLIAQCPPLDEFGAKTPELVVLDAIISAVTLRPSPFAGRSAARHSFGAQQQRCPPLACTLIWNPAQTASTD